MPPSPRRAACLAIWLLAAAAGAEQRPSDGAIFEGQSGVPRSLKPGETARVTVTMRNSGQNAWTSGAGYKLGAQAPADNRTWRTGRVALPAGPVKQAQRAVFAFDITAPSSTGTFVFQWRMVREHRQWFGQPTAAVPVVVEGNSPGACPLRVQPDGGNLEAKIHVRQQASLFLDATFIYDYGKNEDGSPAGPCGRLSCPLGVDGGPNGMVCDQALVGTPQWSSKTVQLETPWHDNDHFAKVIGGHGEVKVCSQRHPASCGTVMVP